MQEKDVNIKTGFAPSVFIRFTYDFFTRNAKTCSFFFCCCCCFVKIKFFQVFMLSITLYMLMVFILLFFSYRTQTRIIFILTIIISLYLLAWFSALWKWPGLRPLAWLLWLFFETNPSSTNTYFIAAGTLNVFFIQTGHLYHILLALKPRKTNR